LFTDGPYTVFKCNSLVIAEMQPELAKSISNNVQAMNSIGHKLEIYQHTNLALFNLTVKHRSGHYPTQILEGVLS